MIQVNELRTGNLVSHTGKIQRIEWVHIADADYPHGAISTNIMDERGAEEFEPIPLTPEILEACGFRRKVNKYSNEFFYQKEGLWLCLVEDGNRVVPCTLYDGIQFFQSANFIESVHGLQNLYFTLTGTELEVKLPQTV